MENVVTTEMSTEETICIVEDNKPDKKLFNDLVEAPGYNAFGMGDSTEVLRIAREKCPHLIVMDSQLREVSGLETAKWIKGNTERSAIPLIATTAFAVKGEEEKIREGCCEAYSAKPVSVSHFPETVQHFLG